MWAISPRSIFVVVVFVVVVVVAVVVFVDRRVQWYPSSWCQKPGGEVGVVREEEGGRRRTGQRGLITAAAVKEVDDGKGRKYYYHSHTTKLEEISIKFGDWLLRLAVFIPIE